MSEVVSDAKFSVVECTKKLHVEGAEKVTLKSTSTLSAAGNSAVTIQAESGGVSVTSARLGFFGVAPSTQASIPKSNAPGAASVSVLAVTNGSQVNRLLDALNGLGLVSTS